VVLASRESTVSNSAFVSGAAFEIVWDIDALTIFWVARVRSARNFVIASHWSVGTSKLCIANIFGAFVVVITCLWDVKASYLRIAYVSGAFVVVVAKISVVPAFWKSFVASSNFVLHAYNVTSAFLDSSSFAVSTQPYFGTLANVISIAISFFGSTEFIIFV